MITRHVVTEDHPDGDPPRTVHLVDEPGRGLRIEYGSFDFTLDEQGLRFLAAGLAARGYLVQAPGVPLQGAGDGTCGFGWHSTRDGQPVTHICVKQASDRHGSDHMCACRELISVQR